MIGNTRYSYFSARVILMLVIVVLSAVLPNPDIEPFRAYYNFLISSYFLILAYYYSFFLYYSFNLYYYSRCFCYSNNCSAVFSWGCSGIA